jgi:hypothetical protein
MSENGSELSYGRLVEPRVGLEANTAEPTRADQLTFSRRQPGERAELPHVEHAQEGGNTGRRFWIVCILAAVAIATLLADRPITIAASDSDQGISNTTSTVDYAGRAWAR